MTDAAVPTLAPPAGRKPLAELLLLAGPTVAQMASYTLMQFIDVWILGPVGVRRRRPDRRRQRRHDRVLVHQFGHGRRVRRQHDGQPVVRPRRTRPVRAVPVAGDLVRPPVFTASSTVAVDCAGTVSTARPRPRAGRDGGDVPSDHDGGGGAETDDDGGRAVPAGRRPPRRRHRRHGGRGGRQLRRRLGAGAGPTRRGGRVGDGAKHRRRHRAAGRLPLRRPTDRPPAVRVGRLETPPGRFRRATENGNPVRHPNRVGGAGRGRRSRSG